MGDVFTVEEVNLMCIFDTSGRENLIRQLSAAVPDYGEQELVEITMRVINRLSNMSDDDFHALELYPEYEDYNEEQEV